MTRENIERFFRSESSPEEANAIVEYFKEHPDQVDLYLSDEEWEKFQAADKLNPDKTAAFWKEIGSHTIHKATGRLFFLKPLAAAASIILIFFAGWWWFRQPANPVTGKESLISRLIQNTGKEIMVLKLPDNSNVQLMPASSISYNQPFQNDRREIVLKGEAFFNVTKDSLRPFIVFSDAISTKVLGTQFLVTAFDTENTIRVALFSGHVVVEPADSLHSLLKEKVHLLPGDVLLYDKTKMTASLVSAKELRPQKSAVASKPGSANTISDNNWYMFNNQSLADVFDQLQILYNEKIIYSKEDVVGLSFIGKIDKTDTLETILDQIGKLNNLSIIKEQSGFLIRKRR